MSIYFGLMILGMVIREYRLVHYGTSSQPPARQLTTEQIEPIRRAMEDWDVVAAIKRYREAVPDAGLAEARDYVLRLAASLRSQHPGKFVPHFSLVRIMKVLLICAVIFVVFTLFVVATFIWKW
jgi:hypothetical protein